MAKKGYWVVCYKSVSNPLFPNMRSLRRPRWKPWDVTGKTARNCAALTVIFTSHTIRCKIDAHFFGVARTDLEVTWNSAAVIFS